MLSEAEITCQEYAQLALRVKDIDIHTGPGSVERQNPDGHILIKVNIADGNGVFGQEKPLGTMECTTAADGMRVITFSTY